MARRNELGGTPEPQQARWGFSFFDFPASVIIAGRVHWAVMRLNNTQSQRHSWMVRGWLFIMEGTISVRKNRHTLTKMRAVPEQDEAEASYRQAMLAISKIADEEYRAAAAEGLIAGRLKAERLQSDSERGMRIRRASLEALGAI